MKKTRLWLLCFLLLFNINVYSTTVNPSDPPIASYMGDNGIWIISYSEKWNTEEVLKEVFEELVQNIHGEEMDYLSTVYIFPDSKNGVASYYFDSTHRDSKGNLQYDRDRTIHIYNGDQLELPDMSRILSHEYGHHFTFYYLVTREGLMKEEWLSSEYAKIRGLLDYSQITFLGDTNVDYSHKWDIAEILAEDYVQLFGSPLAKETTDYLDAKERLGTDSASIYYYNYHDFNLLPQENLDIQLAADVDGLFDYFCEISGIQIESQPEELQIQAPKFKGIIPVFEAYNAYLFHWEALSEDEGTNDYEYTLVMNEAGTSDYPIPLKTVLSGESFQCTAGSAVNLTKKQGIFKNYEGEYQLRIFVKDRNGYIHSSPITELSITKDDNIMADVLALQDGNLIQPIRITVPLNHSILWFLKIVIGWLS